VPGTTMDDMQLLQSPMDDSNRSRRRSIRADSDLSKPVVQDKNKTDGGSQNLRVVGKRTTHSRNGSSESVESSRSSNSRPSSVSL
jgi:hypothetical protein